MLSSVPAHLLGTSLRGSQIVLRVAAEATSSMQVELSTGPGLCPPPVQSTPLPLQASPGPLDSISDPVLISGTVLPHSAHSALHCPCPKPLPEQVPALLGDGYPHGLPGQSSSPTPGLGLAGPPAS